MGEGIKGHGQTGGGPLAGRGDTLCRENRGKRVKSNLTSCTRLVWLLLWRPAFLCLVIVGLKAANYVIDKSHKSRREEESQQGKEQLSALEDVWLWLLVIRSLLLKLEPASLVGLGGVLRKRWRLKVPLRSWLGQWLE